ncbi:hypothetical protein [Ammoniphilus sp. YIM 78166]|uniref:hypothetical protein n=1 Tax=Ammoniphilus sp. YIM 78166 TaxID=1644106 RepID=UPI00106F188B|nr:hypothetical protein [Ammoniphilus sp. YIM 78166]
MNFFQGELFDQIKQWNTRRDDLDDKIDFIYELIDRDETNRKEDLWLEIKVLNTQREELDDLIDAAYEEVDRVLYNPAM